MCRASRQLPHGGALHQPKKMFRTLPKNNKKGGAAAKEFPRVRAPNRAAQTERGELLSSGSPGLCAAGQGRHLNFQVLKTYFC